MAIVLITGGSGLIGRALTKALQRDGHDVRWLSRMAGERDGVRALAWNIERGEVDARALEGVDHVIHLSGAGIADKRWTRSRLKQLCASRGGAARLLLKVAIENGIRPKSFISASGIGYYGAITGDHVFSENDPPANDTIGLLTKDWEDGADEWGTITRVVKLRTPMVLARNGGALPKLAAPARWGLSAAFGSGKQWMPWVHIDDLVRAYQRAIADDRMHGAYNVTTSDQPVNREFMQAVAKVLGRPFILPAIPALALKIVLGELAHVLLEGSRASNAKLLATGFRFQHGTLSSALKDTLQ